MTRLAIAGLGRWGKVLVDSVHGKSSSVRFTKAVTRDPAKARDYCDPKGIVPVGTLADALADPAVDGIVLATPHSQHAAEIVACAKAKKPVFCDKPVTLTLASGAEALAAVKTSGIVFAAGFNRRWLLPVVDAKRMIAAGELGTILHVETHFSGNAVGRYQPGSSWRIAPGESPAGGLAGSGIHQIDAIIHLVAPITQVFAQSSRRVHTVEMDDTTLVLFKLADGSAASLTTLTATQPTYRLQIFGTKGKVQIDGLAEKRGSETMEVSLFGAEKAVRTYDALDIERAELEAFADAIAGRAPYPITLDEVLNGIAAFEAVSLSAARNAPIAISAGVPGKA